MRSRVRVCSVCMGGGGVVVAKESLSSLCILSYDYMRHNTLRHFFLVRGPYDDDDCNDDDGPHGVHTGTTSAHRHSRPLHFRVCLFFFKQNTKRVRVRVADGGALFVGRITQSTTKV